MAEGWRGRADFTFVAKDIDEASEISEAVDDAIARVTGHSTEGGMLEHMDRDEVIPGSPLDRKLKRSESEAANG